ncbi:hypothetical protein Tco_0303563 [Tanacetum coccineum]
MQSRNQLVPSRHYSHHPAAVDTVVAKAGTLDSTGHTATKHSQALIHATEVNISSSNPASLNLILNKSLISPSQPTWFSTSQFMTQGKTPGELIEVKVLPLFCVVLAFGS